MFKKSEMHGEIEMATTVRKETKKEAKILKISNWKKFFFFLKSLLIKKDYMIFLFIIHYIILCEACCSCLPISGKLIWLMSVVE
jgi:hypothetical protein